MVKLSCGMYGDEACFLLVDIQLSDYVQTLQVAIANKYKKMYLVTLAAGKLQLYFAGTKDGDKTTFLAVDEAKTLLKNDLLNDKYEEIFPTDMIQDRFEADFLPQVDEIHVLVDISKASIPLQDHSNQLAHDVKITIKEDYDDKIADELKYYQDRGELIQKIARKIATKF
ncbi:hypothetical protein AeMF1_007062 [Aphanomyces euteiches]|nr:hypothetical protein AeMF1_007062 [Aphanomyces euteiches]